MRFPFGKFRWPLLLISILGVFWVSVSYQRLFDFTVFWTASRMAESGQPLQAYDPDFLQRAVRQLRPQSQWVFGWYYPPTFYLMIYPLGRLSLGVSYLFFCLISLLGLGGMLYRLLKWEGVLWGLLSSATLLNFFTGQNGLLTAALAATALWNLEKRPILAGVLIGVLSIKPQLGVLFSIALIAGGYWRTLWVAGISALLFMGGAVAILGIDTFHAWLQAIPLSRVTFEDRYAAWTLMPTLFALGRQLGLSVAQAYVGQALGSLLALWAVRQGWRNQNASASLRYALLMMASILATPYAYYYDMTWAVVSLVWLVRDIKPEAWRSWEKVLLGLVWISPLLIGLHFVIPLPIPQISPLLFIGMLLLILRRIRMGTRPDVLLR
ncbi:glycosyltransferase family 87 protein [Ferrovum myxofaciens]|uniref:glycosyltransferase family 87 protein n=1 Tax=Ferrovum myxofaciens TaxID=416213 RepID=UPI003EBBF05B